MNKKFFCLLVGLLMELGLAAQILEPIHWSMDDMGDSVLISATIDEGWTLSIMSIGDTEFDAWDEPEYEAVYTCTMAKSAILPIRYHVCDDHQCLAPTIYPDEAALAGLNPNGDNTLAAEATQKNLVSGDDSTHGLLWIFLMGALAGLLAIFTPCVWPIIPMTVSFFIKRSGGQRGERTSGAIRDAILYGLSIVLIYVGLGLLVTIVFGASALNAMSTNAVVNLIFFAVLVLFAASFFGAFELTLPSSWSTRLNSKSRSTTGFLSVLFMAFTLVIVSFSCTGPIIGTLLVEAAGRSLLAPTLGMLGFALALALPFSLCALFPSMLSKLPKSGGWMNTFKVTLAFLELALSLKFLSVADMAYGWHILDREVFISLWVAIFFLLGLYLVGLIAFPGDDEDHRRTSVSRFFLGLISIAFSLYMLPGLWGAPLKAISAFAPPRSTQDWVLLPGEMNTTSTVEVKHFTDYDEGLAAARKEGLPVLLDFTGFGCVNCRKMEEKVLEQAAVKDRLAHYVMISLYVDDKRERADGQGSIGDYNSRIQRELYGSNAQPFFVQLSEEGQPIAAPLAFTTDPEEFLQWLQY